MTVNYNQDVATERVGGFFRLLFCWRGSIYQAIWGETSIFLLLYFFLSFLYRFGLSSHGRMIFESICRYCDQFVEYIPVTFILGFYLVRVISRRWTMWENMPWPDRISLDLSAYMKGVDVRSRLLRRTVVRYANLASVLCIRDICVPVRKRFPTLDHMITAGFLTPEELKLYEKTASSRDSNWWIPFQWAYTLLARAFQEGKLTEGGMMRLHDAVLDLRNRCFVLFSHDWIPIPMVYTQVCTLSVYLFMVASLFGRQYLDPSKKYPKQEIDLYFPYFTIFQLSFYLGWLKVAEILINPMGCDADDFDMNYVIDRNVRLSYIMVDDNFNRLPPVERDIFWGVEEPDVPHTEGSRGMRNTPFIGSAAEVKVSNNDAQLVTESVGTESTILGDHSERKSSRSNSVVMDRNGMLNVVRRILSRNNSQESSKSPLNKLKKGSRYCSRDSILEEIKETNENLLDIIPSEDTVSNGTGFISEPQPLVDISKSPIGAYHRRYASKQSAPPALHVFDTEQNLIRIDAHERDSDSPRIDSFLSLPAVLMKQPSGDNELQNALTKSNKDSLSNII